MSTTDPTAVSRHPSGAQEQSLFVRQATGLVREGTGYDAMIYNVMWSSVALTLAFYYLLSPAFYQGSSFVVSVLIAAAFGLPGAFLYAMLTRIMPRTGGDYVFVSRTLGPVAGFMSNFSYIFWQLVVYGVYTTFFAVYGAGAFFRMLAGFSGNASLVDIGDWFATEWGTFLSGAVLMILAALIFVVGGTKLFFTIQRVNFLLYVVGAFLLVIVVGALTSHTSFLGSFNDYAQNLGTSGAADKVAASASEAGYTEASFTFEESLLAVSVAWFIFGFIYSSSYWAGEVRMRRRTTLFAIPGAVAVSVVLIVLTIPAFENMVDRTFVEQLGNADPAAYGFAGGLPAYPELAAIGSGSPVLGTLIILGFVAGIVAWLPMTMMLISRCMLAWSFDGVMPEKLAEVSERTHTPVVAVVVTTVFAIVSTAIYSFTDWLTTLVVLLPLGLTLMTVALAGILLPYRRPELFESSSVNRRIGGIPVLSIVGALALAGFAAANAILLIDDGSGTNFADHKDIILISLGVFFVLGPAIYFISKAIRARQGVNLDLAYTQIPPD